MIKSPTVTDKHTNLQGKKVILGLSGGVDSAVAAILLLECGADVQALHMTNWEDDDGYCTAAADLQDARQICEQLKIPLHHVNFAKQYREQVFAYFLDELKVGRTPNPDVLCNREIKFGVFREHAKRLGGEFIATGHYARTTVADGQVQLLKAVDQGKDQSYFLHAVSAEALAETIFPLGELCKDEVRSIAREHALGVHDKKDSTGICFIGERPFREFLATYLPANPGPMKTPEGLAVGDHRGLMYYTLGQRQGLGIGGVRNAAEEPWYVAAKDSETNTLVVVQGDHPLLYSDAIYVTDASWIAAAPAALARDKPYRCAVKIRYRQADQECTLTRSDAARLSVRFDTPLAAATPGQFAVFYSADCCLGGAVIERTIGVANTLRKTA
jgi:tRNA-specific 2-thiouridylase